MATKQRQPRELPRRRYPLALNGELAGYHVTMGAMHGRELIRLQRGEMTEADVLELIAERCVEHDFGIADLQDLDFWMLTELLDAWQAAMKDTALPPVPSEP
jgi:hypothetical protein